MITSEADGHLWDAASWLAVSSVAVQCGSYHTLLSSDTDRRRLPVLPETSSSPQQMSGGYWPSRGRWPPDRRCTVKTGRRRVRVSRAMSARRRRSGSRQPPPPRRTPGPTPAESRDPTAWRHLSAWNIDFRWQVATQDQHHRSDVHLRISTRSMHVLRDGSISGQRQNVTFVYVQCTTTVTADWNNSPLFHTLCRCTTNEKIYIQKEMQVHDQKQW